MNADESVPHLIELDEALNNERTVFIMPPEPPPSSTATYSYNGVRMLLCLRFFMPMLVHQAKSYKSLLFAQNCSISFLVFHT